MTDLENRLRRAFHALADTVDVEPAPLPVPRRHLAVPLAAAAATVLVAGTIAVLASRPGPAPVPPATPPAPTATPVTLPGFALLTHCGVDEVRIGTRYYEAVTPLIGPAHSAPPGWDNPYQHGTMTLDSPDSAVFRDDRGHEVRFRVRDGATAFKQLCE